MSELYVRYVDLEVDMIVIFFSVPYQSFYFLSNPHLFKRMGYRKEILSSLYLKYEFISSVLVFKSFMINMGIYSILNNDVWC